MANWVCIDLDERGKIDNLEGYRSFIQLCENEDRG
jgi:hypothetical protein